MLATYKAKATKAALIGIPGCLICVGIAKYSGTAGTTGALISLVTTLVGLGLAIYVMLGCGWLLKAKGYSIHFVWLYLINPVIAWIVVLLLADRHKTSPIPGSDT